MNTQEFLLFGTQVWFWIVFGILLISLFAAEKTESGTFATISFAVFIIISYKWGNLVDLFTSFITWGKIIIYLVVGFIYCLFRFFIWGREMSKNDDYRRYKDIKSTKKRNNMIRWWLNWPVSLLWWILSDLIQNIGQKLYNLFGGLFQKMFDLGQTSVKK